jgi:glutathione synthase/RimK-type ligase-like ATP-grasp enzyme
VSAPVLLIVTNKADPHADEVIRSLAARGSILPLRLNTDDFLDNVHYTFGWDRTGDPTSSVLHVLDSGIRVDQVKVGWWRKPGSLQASPDLSDPEAVRVVVEEGNALLRTIDAPFPDLNWVNPPDAIYSSGRKLHQISTARDLGLSIPETLVTNDETAAIDFIRYCQRCIAKPLAAAAFFHEEKSWGMFTSKITVEDIYQLRGSIKYSPVMIQREIEKYRELRITIIGKTVFSCEIETKDTPFEHVRTDWRTIEPEKLPHKMVSIPESLSLSLQSMLKHYGLNYGAFDIIQEPDGEYYFLELNPNGQYLWIELITGAPLTAAMVDLIERLADTDGERDI